MSFKNYLAAGAIAIASYATPVSADNADLSSVVDRAGKTAKNLVLGIPRGVETTLNQYSEGNAVERVVLSHTDGAGVVSANGSQVVRHASAGLADIPGGAINAGLNAVNVRSVAPSIAPVFDGAADAVQSASKSVYGLLTGWARSD